jgi:hypothetical protein
MGDLKIEIFFGSSTEDVLDFKCCSFIDQNAEILVYNIGKKPITISSSCRLDGNEKSEQIDHLYPHGQRTITPGGVEAFYCKLAEDSLIGYRTITFRDIENNEHSYPLVMHTTGETNLGKKYEHSTPGEQFVAAAGSYTIESEQRIDLHERELLYVKAHGVFDSSCCGVGGVGYVFVPGFVLAWKSTVNDAGHDVSEVEPITDEKLRQEISAMIREIEKVNQVNFL